MSNLEDLICCRFVKLAWSIVLILASLLDVCWRERVTFLVSCWIEGGSGRVNKFGVAGTVDQPCIIQRNASFMYLTPTPRHNHRPNCCWCLGGAHETIPHCPPSVFQAHHNMKIVCKKRGPCLSILWLERYSLTLTMVFKVEGTRKWLYRRETCCHYDEGNK